MQRQEADSQDAGILSPPSFCILVCVCERDEAVVVGECFVAFMFTIHGSVGTSEEIICFCCDQLSVTCN